VTSGADGNELIRAARNVLLIDWPSRDVPDILARAGLEVFALEADDLSFRYEVNGKQVVRRGPVQLPVQVDIVYAHRPPDELPGIVERARMLGAQAVWVESAQTAEARRLVESAGLAYIDQPKIAHAARALDTPRQTNDGRRAQ
jgi:predicted CoA-binding protein